MSNYKAIVGISSQTNELVEPGGLTSLKISIEQDNDRQFFRQKISGGIEFNENLFGFAKPLENVCCQTVPVTIFRSCENTQTRFIDAQFKTNQIEWDFELCSAKVPELEIIDKYKEVYKVWEKKINLCSIVRNKTLEYVYRKPRTVIENGSEIELFDYVTVQNNRGVLFSEWILFAIKKTFLSTQFESFTPLLVSQMSELFSRNINPCTGLKNTLKTALIYQASDAMFPETLQQSTGLLEDGRINEDIALSLKEVLEMLKTVFDIHWHIDTNGKFRIEHLSYYKNGLSYDLQTQTSLDFREQKYSKHLQDYKYSYKLDNENLIGKEELKFTNNEAINKSKQAMPYVPNGTIQQQRHYKYSKIDDFELGNIKYSDNCVSEDEQGEPSKKVSNDDKLITHWEAVRMADESVELTKWVLLDVAEKPNELNIFVVQNGLCERTTATASNAEFSASKIVKNFHRWDKPFSKGLMNYSESPNGLIGKGFVRNMFSVKKTKQLKKFTIPFCCKEQVFNPYLPIILPNGTKSFVSRAEFDLSDETLSIDVVQNSNCGLDIQFPNNSGGTEYPIAGTILSTEIAESSCPVTSYDEPSQECLVFWKNVTGVRTIYADGFGGSYFEDAIDFDSQCINEC